jgi:hypothetical protein
MKSVVYRLLGYYNIIMGALLAVFIFVLVAMMFFKVFAHHTATMNYMQLGIIFIIYMILFIICLIGVRSGVLLNREQAVGIRGAFVAMLPQLVAVSTNTFTYVFHYGLFFDVGVVKRLFMPSEFNQQWAIHGVSSVLLGPPTLNGVAVPMSAVYFNLTACLCCCGLLYLWLQERSAARSSLQQ